MTVTTRTITQTELENQRGEILADLGVGFEALQHLYDQGYLTGEQWLAWEQLQRINFLLND